MLAIICSQLIILAAIIVVGLNASNPELCSGGCVVCNYPARLCLACGSNYELTIYGKCLQVSGGENCRLFGVSVTDCRQCRPTFKLASGICVKDYSGCLNYSKNTCLTCAYGKTLIEN